MTQNLHAAFSITNTSEGGQHHSGNLPHCPVGKHLYFCNKSVLPKSPLGSQYALLHCRCEAVLSENGEIQRDHLNFGWWPDVQPCHSRLSLFSFWRQTEREVHRRALSQTGCLATRAEQRLQCHSLGCQHWSWITLHWDSKKEKEWNRDEDREESEGDG